MTLTTEQLRHFAAGLAASPERWSHHVRHADDVRVYAQIWDDDEVNAWVICWSEDQDTGFHDHDESAAAIQVISGHVREDRLRLDGPPQTRIFGPSERFSLPASAIHRVLHAGNEPAVTIHAYSPPLRRTGAYAVTPDGILERTALRYEVELRAEPALTAGVR